MKSLERYTGLIGLVLLVAFLVPYVWTSPQIYITLNLLGGLSLTRYDYFSSGILDKAE